MNQHEYEVVKHVAEQSLDMKIDYDCNGKVQMDLCGHVWKFEKETDAEVMEKIAKIWEQLCHAMAKTVDQKLLHWAAVNKKNFN